MIQNYVGLFKEISKNLVTQYPFYLHSLHNTQSFQCLKEKTSASERQSTRFMYWRPLYACMAQVCRLAYKLFDNCGPLTSLDILRLSVEYDTRKVSRGAFLWENPNPDSCIQKRILRFFT